MLITRYLWRKAFPTLVMVGAFLLLYEATVSDSRYAARQEERLGAMVKPAPGARLTFSATAYCKGSMTASGVLARSGVAAADPDLLPVGSVVQLESADNQYSGVYTIMDTGPLVQGRLIDLYIWSCNEALRFGRRPVHVVVLRLGWDPRASTPRSDALFRERESTLPASPLAPQLAMPTPAVP